MCGIAGAVNWSGEAMESSLLERARDALLHRGPDGHGIWRSANGRAALVHTRLAIQDVDHGHQPLSNENGDVHVVFNGEIYNHIELRQELEEAGHSFRTRCDTEVLVHLYEEHGTDLCRHLIGMFAFAIWDERRECLLLARDRLGQKPLYVASLSNGIAFASEIKALMPLLPTPPSTNMRALHDYLTLKYVPHERSASSGISQPGPAEIITVDRDRRSSHVYWSLPEVESTPPGSFEESADQLRETLLDATRLRLRSDVPVGVLLSGGIDSALVVGLMAEAGAQPIRTFTVGFGAEGADERQAARRIARRYGTEHHELEVPAPGADRLNGILDHFDDPFADTSCVPTWSICEEARRHVKVVLTGDGGDESFLGYQRYAEFDRFLRRRRWRSPLARGSGAAFLGRAVCPDPGRRTWRRRLRTFTNFHTTPPARAYLAWYAAFFGPLKARLLTEAWHEAVISEDCEEAMAGELSRLAYHHPWLTAAARYDLFHYLPDAVLTKVDRASMAHGLECRSPFLDHRVVELAARFPQSWKHGPGGQSKWILRAACRDLLPDETLQLPKVGFGAPVGAWLRHYLPAEGPWELPDALERWISDTAVQELVEDHRSGRENHAYRLWTLAVLFRFWQRRLA